MEEKRGGWKDAQEEKLEWTSTEPWEGGKGTEYRLGKGQKGVEPMFIEPGSCTRHEQSHRAFALECASMQYGGHMWYFILTLIIISCNETAVPSHTLASFEVLKSHMWLLQWTTLIEDRRGFHGPRGWAWSMRGRVRKSEIMQGRTCYKMKEYNIVYLKYNSQK